MATELKTSRRFNVRPFSASVSYRGSAGENHEDTFPVVASDPAAASNMAFSYVLHVLNLKEFELRIVGS